MGRRHGLNN